MTIVIDGTTGISPVTASGTSASVDGMTVGRGGGEVSTNTAVGASALNGNSTGVQNAAIGYQSLYASTGGYNTAVGYQSGYGISTGTGNSALGRGVMAGATVTGGENTGAGNYALNLVTSGAQNTAIGASAGTALTTGSANTAIGFSALQANTTASNNTAVGYQALYNNAGGNGTTAASNSVLGYQAGYTNTIGYGGVLIGYQAGYSNSTGAYNVFLGTQAGYSTTASNNTFLGNTAGYAVTSGAKNTIVGQYNGNQGSLDIRTASNYVVLSDGDGNVQHSSYNGGTTALQGAVPNAGCGITFPATQNASSNANTLDDYEEGTWTPGLSFGGGTTGITYSTQSGGYIKVGAQVTVWAYIVLSSKGSATGPARVTGLPFTNVNAPGRSEGATASSNYWQNFSGTPIPLGYVQNNSTTIYLGNGVGANTIGSLDNTNFNNNTSFYFNATYSTV